MAHHECTFSLQADTENRYLTGRYVCTVCGAKKYMKSVHAVGLWHEQLRAIVENRERHIEEILNRILRTGTVSEAMATSVTRMDRSVVLLKRSLLQFEKTSRVFERTTPSASMAQVFENPNNHRGRL